MPKEKDDYGKRLDAIHERIAKRLGEKPTVFYSAYKTDQDGLPIDNLDDIAVEGEVQFHAQHDPYWGGGRGYDSEQVESWLEIAVLANAMIKTTGDFHHQFLEAINVTGDSNGVKTARFSMGS